MMTATRQLDLAQVKTDFSVDRCTDETLLVCEVSYSSKGHHGWASLTAKDILAVIRDEMRRRGLHSRVLHNGLEEGRVCPT